MDQTITTISQLGGTVFTVCAFLWYLSKYQDKQVAAQITLAIALENLTNQIIRNSSTNTTNSVATDKNTLAMK
jgi:hypothetical protein